MQAERAIEDSNRYYRKVVRRVVAIAKIRMEERTRARDDGRKAGRKEGIAKGHAEAQIKIARKMKKMGMPVSQIVEVTGLLLETIERL